MGRIFEHFSSVRLIGVVSFVLATSLIAGCRGSTGEDGEASADCDEYPAEDIEFVVPYDPGGGFDATARLIAPYIEENLPNDASVVVRNEPGAGGQTGTARTYASEPDGTRIQILDLTGLTMAQLTGEANFDLRELTYLGRVSTGSRLVAVAGDSEIETMEDLVEFSQARPVRQAITGFTGTDGVATVIVYDAFGIEYSPITHEGASDARLSVIRGDSDAVISALDSALSELQSGDLKPILFFSEEKPAEGESGYEEVRDVPTATDAGYSELEGGFLDTQRLIGGPPDMPECIRDVLDQAVQAAVADPEFREQAEESELPPNPLDATESADLVEETIASFSEYEELLTEAVSRE